MRRGRRHRVGQISWPPPGSFVAVSGQFLVSAVTLDRRWHKQHSDNDGSEFSVEGLYSPHFDAGSRGVPVPVKSLGSTCLTQIAGFVAMISLPFMPPTPKLGQSISLQQPYFHHQWLRDGDWSGFVNIKWGWGIASTTTGQGFVQAFRVAVDPESVTPEEAGKFVQQELPEWWRRAVDWLELLSANHVRSVDDFRWSEGTPALYTWSAEDQLKHVPAQSWMRSTPRLTSAWKAINYWPSAVQLAGLDQRPPLSCTLLVAALRAFREGEYRTCVADAGTAAEVALGEALRRIKNPPNDKDTLGTVAKNARTSIHGLVPAVFKRRMVDVRNRVIHDGASVDVDTAADAFTLAQRVVHSVYPLPATRGRQRRPDTDPGQSGQTPIRVHYATVTSTSEPTCQGWDADAEPTGKPQGGCDSAQISVCVRTRLCGHHSGRSDAATRRFS